MDNLFGVTFFSGSAADAIQVLLSRLNSTKHAEPFVVFTPNVEQLMLARRNPAFLAALQQADLNLPDSVGVVWAGRSLGIHQFAQRRIAGREMVSSLLPHLKSGNKKLMLIGGMGNTAKLAAEHLQLHYPGLQVKSHAGAANAHRETAEETAAIFKDITAYTPDMVLVAYGAPAQEFWVLKHKDQLEKHGVKVVMVVGGVLDLLSGKLKTPPTLFSAFGLEWLWRLLQEPRRVKRQLALPKFVLSVWKQKFLGR